MAKDFILTLYSRPETVFTMRELSLLFPHISYDNIKSKTHYFVSKKKLFRVRNGIYTKESYNPLELSRLYIPSYISLETVFQTEGMIFQHDTSIHMISYLSRSICIDAHKLIYRKMNERILLNNTGIEERAGYAIATKERAFLDALFLFKDYHFDNLNALDWALVETLAPIYHSAILIKRAHTYYKQFQTESHA